MSLRNSAYPRIFRCGIGLCHQMPRSVKFTCQAISPSIRRIVVLSPSGSFRAYTFWTLSEARSRLYQRRFLRSRAHFSAFFKLYIFSFAPFQISVIFQAFAPFFAKFWRIFCKISNKTADFANFRQISTDFVRNFAEFLQ